MIVVDDVHKDFKLRHTHSIKETFLSWTLMETIVSVVGLICVLLLNSVIS